MDGDLLFEILDLLEGDGVFLVKCGLKLNELVLLTLKCIYGRLKIVLLVFKLIALLLEFVDLTLSDCARFDGNERHKHGRNEDERKEDGKSRSEVNFRHNVPPFTK